MRETPGRQETGGPKPTAPAVDKAIRQLLETGSGTRAREEASQALISLDDPSAHGPLIKALENGDKDIREIALKTLVKMRALQPLIKALDNGNDLVRRNAAEALGELGETDAIIPLIRMLGDSNNFVRESAADALARLGEPRWKQLVPEDPWHVDWQEDSEYFERLAACGDARVFDALIYALECGRHDPARYAARALGALGDKRAVEPLIECLSDGDVSMRASAAEALGKLRDLRAAKPLIDALDDKQIGLYAAMALGELGDPASVQCLTVALEDGTHRLHASAALVFGVLRDARAFDPLIKMLESSDAEIRLFSAQALGRLGDVRAVDPLIEALEDGDLGVKECAVEALGALGDARAVEPLILALRDDHIRKYAAEALGRFGDPRAIEPLISALGCDDKDLRKIAADALAKLGEPQWNQWVKGDDGDFGRLGESGDARFVESLIKALGSMESDVRQNAAASLAKLGEPKWSQWIKGDHEDFSRLGESGDGRVLQPLIRVLKTAWEGKERQSAAVGLGKLGDTRGVDALIEALGNKDKDLRKSAAEALAKLGEPRWSQWAKGDSSDFQRLAECGDARIAKPVINALVRVLRDENMGGTHLHDSWDRARAAEVLGNLGDNVAVEPLIATLADGDVRVCRSAIDALQRLGDVRALEPLIKVLSDTNGEVRKQTAEALAKLGAPQWCQWIQGDEGDAGRLRESGHAQALELFGRMNEKLRQEVEQMIEHLESGNWEARQARAKALLHVAKTNPRLLGMRWSHVARVVGNPHTDKTEHVSHDCCPDQHSDQGIGMIFPATPANLEF